MSSTRFTKGPWIADQYNDLMNKEGKDVSVWNLGVAWVSRDEESEANANLIRTSPELYKELDEVHKLICEASKTGFNPLDGDWADRLFRSQGSRFEVLKKARGE